MITNEFAIEAMAKVKHPDCQKAIDILKERNVMEDDKIKKDDALAHAGKKLKFSKKDKIEFAKKKQEEETAKALNDPKVVKESSEKFNKKINKDREDAGLPPLKKEKPKKIPMIVNTKRFTVREVKVELSQDERDTAARELACQGDERVMVEIEMKQHMSQYKDRIKEIDAKMADLRRKANTGVEFRKFSCEVWLNFKTKERVYKDRENHKVIDTAGLEADDYQLRLAV